MFYIYDNIKLFFPSVLMSWLTMYFDGSNINISLSPLLIEPCCVILVIPHSPHSRTGFSAHLWYISHLSVEEILNLCVHELSLCHFESAHNDSYHHMNYL